METIMNLISENWFWLGPLLLVVFGWLLIELVWSILKGAVGEIEDATKEWREAGDQMSEIRRQIVEGRYLKSEAGGQVL